MLFCFWEESSKFNINMQTVYQDLEYGMCFVSELRSCFALSFR